MRRLSILLIVAILLAACDSATSPTSEPTAPADANPTDTTSVPTPTRESDDGQTTSISAPATGGDIEGDPGSGFGLEPVIETDSGFQAVISGDADRAVTGSGYYACENGRYALRDSDRAAVITLLLPADITPDAYDLVSNTGDASQPTAAIFLPDGRAYSGNINGILVINDLALNPGETVSGSFDFSASNGSATISVRGEFNFQSGDVAYCE